MCVCRALASVKATLGPAFATAPQDVEMEVEAVAIEGLQGDAKTRVEETTKRCVSSLLARSAQATDEPHANKSLSATRKKRKVAPEYVKPAELKNYVQQTAITSLHGTKPPGITALDLAKSGSLIVTGGFVPSPLFPLRAVD